MLLEAASDGGEAALDSVTIYRKVLKMTITDQIQPLYTIYYYTDFLYRIVKFKRSSSGVRLVDRDLDDLPVDKFEQSYCRARSMVLQYALCNQWDYFITITVNEENFDRYDLEPISKSLKQWFLDQNKKQGRKIDFLLVPEHHQDGAWHFHGLIRGVSSLSLCAFPDDPYRPSLKRLHDHGYKNWPSLSKKIGFVSLSPLRDPVGAGFYVCKYVTKEKARSGFYEHLYYVSRGLKTAQPVADCYTYDPTLESSLESENEFCFTGWMRAADWHWPLSDCYEPRCFDFLVPVKEEVLAAESNLTFVQLSLADWLSDSGGLV